MVPVIAAAAAASAFGGLLWWARDRAKLKNGDTAFVPVRALKSIGPIPVNPESFEALGLVKLENVTRGKGDMRATGTAGRELGLSIQFGFDVAAVEQIERAGQRFANPEKSP